MKRWLRHNAALLAFVIVAFASGYALHENDVKTAHTLYENSYHSCIRGNAVRTKIKIGKVNCNKVVYKP